MINFAVVNMAFTAVRTCGVVADDFAELTFANAERILAV